MFQEASQVTALGDGRFSATVDASWSQGRGVYGGMVAALLTRALVAMVDAPDRHLRTLTVHIDVAAAESGVSRFGEAWSAQPPPPPGMRAGWQYDKTEGLTDPLDFARFDFLLTENATFHASLFEVVEAVHTYARLDWRALTPLGPTLVMRPRLYIMRRRADDLAAHRAQAVRERKRERKREREAAAAAGASATRQANEN